MVWILNIIQETFIHTFSTRQKTGRVTIFNIRGSIWWTLCFLRMDHIEFYPFMQAFTIWIHGCVSPGPLKRTKTIHTYWVSQSSGCSFTFPPLDGNRFPLAVAPFVHGPTPVNLKVGQRRPRRVFVYTGSWTSPFSLQKSPHNPTTRRPTMCVFIRATNNEGSLCFWDLHLWLNNFRTQWGGAILERRQRVWPWHRAAVNRAYIL